MRILMISLDKKIFEPDSPVAKRMVEYGKENELFILLPHTERKEMSLSDRVHVWTTGGNKFQQYLRLKEKGLELLQNHDVKFITVQDPSFSGNIGRWLKKKTGSTLEIQLHGDFYGSDFYKRSLKSFIGYYLFGKKNIRSADRVRVVSERVKKTILALGIEEKRIVVKPVSLLQGERLVDVDEVDMQKKFTGFERYFLFVGRLEDVKNISLLIDIFEEVVRKYGRNFLLLIIGDGSQKNHLRQVVQQKNIDKNVKFMGYTTNPNAYYSSAHCVLFPSTSEGYGLVPMEAHAAGTPVIMNDVGVANYELKPSENVKIIPVTDREAWIRAILSI